MKRRLQEMEVNNKKVLLRCDFNVPIKDGKIIDDSKIRESLQTIQYLIDNNAKTIILSHFGKIKKEEDKQNNSLEPVAQYLQNILKTKVIFSKQTRSVYLESKIEEMKPGEVIILENTRFEDVPNKLESGNDPQLAMYWSELADIFCLDAFGSAHRKHASTYGVAKYLPSCIGFLVQKEIDMLDKYIINAQKPFTILMGGAKVEDKVSLLEALLPKCDNLLLTGGIANSCLNILEYNVGESVKTSDPKIMEKIKQLLINNKEKIHLPVDAIIGNHFNKELIKHVNIDEVQDDDYIGDIGMKTVNEYKQIIDQSATVFVNGTAGIYEDMRFATGTREILNVIAKSKSIKVVGGGDGVSAVKSFKLTDQFTFLSTGGGATLEYIINKGLPAIDNINDGD